MATMLRIFERLAATLAGTAILLAPTLLVARAALADIPTYDRVRVLAAPRQIGEAELTDQDGKPFRLSELRGKAALVLFGFTNCPDVCPVAMERLRELHDSGSLTEEDVAYVMISVDGDRDTPAAMKAFLANYADEFIGLTAEPSTVKPIATQFSAAFFKGHAGHDGGYDVAHSPQIFVLDANGRLRAELFGASLDAITGVIRALAGESR
jgi:protein SCO1/2